MKEINNIPLSIAFIVLVIISILLCGGTITMTMMDNYNMGGGLFNNISWMWVPTIVSFFLSGLVGWAMFWKKV